nr:immunoglobulin heavy chain junction region [Macaca mulatta]
CARQSFNTWFGGGSLDVW